MQTGRIHTDIMSTMAVQRPSSAGRPSQITTPNSDGQPSEYFGYDDAKENVALSPRRKPLSDLAISPSGRMHGAPMTPVKVNVQSEEWVPRPSSAGLEGLKLPMRSFESEDEAVERPHSPPESTQRPKLQQSPHRQSRISVAKDLHEPQAGVISMSSPRSALIYGERKPSQQMSDGIPEILQSEEYAGEAVQAAPALEYHHQKTFSLDSRPQAQDGTGLPNRPTTTSPFQNAGMSVSRNLTPLQFQSGLPRPESTYSDLGRRSPGNFHDGPNRGGLRMSSGQARRSPDSRSRPMSYVDLLNTSYPQTAPAPLSVDNSYLRTVVGTNASLLSTQKTLEMYRQNVKKTDEPSIQYAFALFLIGAAQEAGLNEGQPDSKTKRNSPKPRHDRDSPYIEASPSSGPELLREARHILSKLADRSYPFAQYYLADGYSSGLFNKGKEDYDRAFPLFIAASKHGHAESGYRAALCYEFGWGCRKDPAKAVQFYRQSASKNHPGAMTRLGRACLSGDLGIRNYREGLKWLKRATESADRQYNAAPYHLALLYETGYGDDLFKDETYAAQLLTQAADLGHVEASYRLGDAYEHGKLTCPKDPALSVHWYTGAAEAGHPAAMMALCAWYMIGAEPVLEKDENEAYEWARRAAECGKFCLSTSYHQTCC